MSYQSTFKTT